MFLIATFRTLLAAGLSANLSQIWENLGLRVERYSLLRIEPTWGLLPALAAVKPTAKDS
jgi:hypothetical protein